MIETVSYIHLPNLGIMYWGLAYNCFVHLGTIQQSIGCTNVDETAMVAHPAQVLHKTKHENQEKSALSKVNWPEIAWIFGILKWCLPKITMTGTSTICIMWMAEWLCWIARRYMSSQQHPKPHPKPSHREAQYENCPGLVHPIPKIPEVHVNIPGSSSTIGFSSNYHGISWDNQISAPKSFRYTFWTSLDIDHVGDDKFGDVFDPADRSSLVL